MVDKRWISMREERLVAAPFRRDLHDRRCRYARDPLRG
jgi:hypothetical protein